jgi:EAL domain-containing protein (putative c-di-GMP-specific phosphodiesterase class I)
VRLLGELRQAVDRRELVTVYQPKYDLRSEKIVGVEALVRWPHPDRGLLRPEQFLPLVRQHGLMRAVTERVLAQALDDAVLWHRRGARIPVCVNLFAASLADVTMAAHIVDALARHELPADSLIIEITEDLLVEDIGRARAMLATLRGHGIRVALDDFGSGYSALSYLRELPIDEVKLDKDFIAPILVDPRAAAIVRAVVDLAHALGVTTIAEGVESAETAAALRDYGCDVAQGFYYSPPITASAVIDLLTRGAHT